MVMLFFAQDDWEAAGHSEGTWLEALGSFGAALLAVAFFVVLLRALMRRHRYRAVHVLKEDDLKAVHSELAATEKRTVGEVLPVVLERSDRYPGANWLAATFFVLVGSTLLAGVLPWHQPAFLLACQVVLGAVGYGAARSLPDFQRLFLREKRAREQAEEQALQEFYKNGLHETEAKTGVLLFVSLLEHRVIVLADTGINAKVKPEHWIETDGAILEGIRGGSLRDGLVAGIRSAGEVLAEHFPWEEGDRNEIPDRVIVRRE